MLSNVLAARRLGASLTAVIGFMNIISALYPAIPARMELLRDLLPLSSIRASQTATVLIGFALILVADGLWKRRRRAFQLTVILLLLSCMLNLAKGLDFEEAILNLGMAALLIHVQDAFDVRGHVPTPGSLAQAVLSFILLYYGYVLAGFLILRNAIRPAPSVVGVALEPFRLLLGDAAYHYTTHQAHWFERSLAFAGSLAVLLSLYRLLRPFIPHRAATPDELSRARALVRRYGNDTLSYFALQAGRSYYFHPAGDAFLSYRLWGNVALVGGDPIGPAYRAEELVRHFLAFCDAGGMVPCFLGVGPAGLPVYRSFGLKALKIGEEALIDLPTFDRNTLKRKVRRAARHVSEAGITVQMYRAPDIPESVRAQMKEISTRWVQEKGGHEKGFSMTLGRLPDESDEDCEVAVAMQGAYLWGYLSMVPVYGTNGWSLDAMRRRPESPNGLTEFLVIEMCEHYRARGFRAVSLNFATLSNSEDDIDSRAIESTRRFLYEQLSGFYQLKSLHQFNSKFVPRWRSRYLAYGDVLTFPKVALAVVQSEDPLKLPSLVAPFRR